MNFASTPVLSDSQILGIDVSKAWFDVFLHPAAVKARFDNDIAGFRKLVRWLNSVEVEIVVMEVDGELVYTVHRDTAGQYRVLRHTPPDDAPALLPLDQTHPALTPPQRQGGRE